MLYRTQWSYGSFSWPSCYFITSDCTLATWQYLSMCVATTCSTCMATLPSSTVDQAVLACIYHDLRSHVGHFHYSNNIEVFFRSRCLITSLINRSNNAEKFRCAEVLTDRQASKCGQRYVTVRSFIWKWYCEKLVICFKDLNSAFSAIGLSGLWRQQIRLGLPVYLYCKITLRPHQELGCMIHITEDRLCLKDLSV